MRLFQCLPLVALTSLITASGAANVGYVTDIDIYSLLAPCAASAVSYNVGAATYRTRCGSAEGELQTCVCSSAPISQSVFSSISSDVSASCGSSATDDFWSVSKFMEKYCNQALTVTFSTPTTNIVRAYITDLPELEYLPPCAQSAVSMAVMGPGYYRCPQAAELYAPCVCSKENVVSSVNATLRSSVKYSCSNNEDITAATNFYNEYCAMNQGTTSFAPPAGPPGDMTYYITAMPQYKSLRTCAQSGISSAVMGQSALLCGNGPQALASCVCIKSGMSGMVSSSLTSAVKGYCDSTAISDVNSALSVWSYYCSAAESKVVAAVDESIAQSYPTPTAGATAPGTQPAQPGTHTGSSPAKETGATNTGSPGSKGDESSETVSIGPIAGGVVGGLAIIAAGLGVLFFFRRRRQTEKRGEQLPGGGDGPNPSGGHEFNGKAELMGSAPGTPATTPSKTGSPFAPPPVPPMPAGNYAFKPELDGTKPVSELPQNQMPTAELYGQGAMGVASPYGHPQQGWNSQQMPQELGGSGYGYQQQPHLNGQPVYEFPAHPAPTHRPYNQPGSGWQSGPVEAYEMDSNIGRRQL